MSTPTTRNHSVPGDWILPSDINKPGWYLFTPTLCLENWEPNLCKVIESWDGVGEKKYILEETYTDVTHFDQGCRFLGPIPAPHD